MKVLEKRALALTAMMRHYPTNPGEPLPSWIGELALGPVPDFRVYDRLVRDGLIAWDGSGWHLTNAGRAALTAAAPRKRGA